VRKYTCETKVTSFNGSHLTSQDCRQFVLDPVHVASTLGKYARRKVPGEQRENRSSSLSRRPIPPPDLRYSCLQLPRGWPRSPLLRVVFSWRQPASPSLGPAEQFSPFPTRSDGQSNHRDQAKEAAVVVSRRRTATRAGSSRQGKIADRSPDRSLAAASRKQPTKAR
jgi:hypothetical protein